MIDVGRSVVILAAAVLLALPAVDRRGRHHAGPGGRLLDGARRRPADEAPLHRVYVRDFWIERHKVTNAEFAAF